MSQSPSVTQESQTLFAFISFAFFPTSAALGWTLSSTSPATIFSLLFSKETWEALAQHPAMPASTSSRPSLPANIPIVIAFLGCARSGFASNWQLEVISRVIFSSPARQPPPHSSPPPLLQEAPAPQRPLVAFWNVSPGSDASNLPVKIPPTKEQRRGKKWLPRTPLPPRHLESTAALPLR